MNEREKFDPSKLEAVKDQIPWNVSLASVVTYIYLTQIPEVIEKVIENAVNHGEIDWQGIGVITAASLFTYASFDVVKTDIATKNDLREMQANEAYIASL